MKSRRLACITTMTLLSALAIQVQLTAQSALGLKYTVLYTFTGGTDGAIPYLGSLIQDESGNLYGTTFVAGDLSACAHGSETGCGVVFKVDPAGNETVLHSFMSGTDGANPEYGLVLDPAGNLYGTTTYGGVSGTVYKVDPQHKETLLYSFTGGADGNTPESGLVRDDEGNLYGSTSAGGNLSSCAGLGCGLIYKIDPMGHETVLHSFTGPDGANPSGDLVWDNAGNLCGTTFAGGTSNAGVVFKVDPSGQETFVYSFTGGADGAQPFAGLVLDGAGNLYGTASAGGASGAGVVFKVDTTGHETVLYSFTGGADGFAPDAFPAFPRPTPAQQISAVHQTWGASTDAPRRESRARAGAQLLQEIGISSTKP